MGRSRSRSPVGTRRERRRSRERERDLGRERDPGRPRHRSPDRPPRRGRSRSPVPHRRRSRSPRRRSRSPQRRRSRSHSRERNREREAAPKKKNPLLAERAPLEESDFAGKSEEEIEMMKLMGFGGFETTKGKHVPGNEVNHAKNIINKRKYRQYMNRKGGFNRPLDFIA